MKFRPCIDIHNGKVKQVVGSSIKDAGDSAKENFVSEKNADYYGDLYKKHGLTGGHIILLNAVTSKYYNDTKEQAMLALKSFNGGMELGGGVRPDNAREFLEAGASHVIVTSYVFSNGVLNYDNLKEICKVTGKEKLVLDLSCRKKDGKYFIVTDRWQNFTKEEVDISTLQKLSEYCDEFLIHAVDVEGKNNGVETELVNIIGKWDKSPITYAGGIRTMEDIEKLRQASNNNMDFTVGSALDIFGGHLSFEKLAEKYS